MTVTVMEQSNERNVAVITIHVIVEYTSNADEPITRKPCTDTIFSLSRDISRRGLLLYTTKRSSFEQ